MIVNSSFQFSKLCIGNCRDGVLEVVHNTNVVFGVGMSKDETCFEQINVVSSTLKCYGLLLLFWYFAHFKLIFGDCV